MAYFLPLPVQRGILLGKIKCCEEFNLSIFLEVGQIQAKSLGNDDFIEGFNANLGYFDSGNACF